MRCAYLFEAKGIQRWILEGGRLRDIAAGSAVTAWAASGSFSGELEDLLALVLSQTRFSPVLSRRAGGAFMLHYGEADAAAFERFRALWRLSFSRLAPGLEFSEGLASDPGSDVAAGTAAYAPDNRCAADRQNSHAAVPPFAHPLTRLARRTGRPVVELGGGFDPDEEGLDVTLAQRRRAWKAITGRNDAHLIDRPAEILGRDLLATTDGAGEPVWPGLAWPDRMEEDGRTQGVLFPFLGSERRIAVIHADISALGTFYSHLRTQAALTDRPLDFMRGASLAIEEAVAAAAASAAAITLKPIDARTREQRDADDPPIWVMPARPVLIGGDDITLIVRADKAMDFTEAFLETLEQQSLEKLEAFLGRHGAVDKAGLAVRLTAAAGIAVGGPKQPFYRLLRLAEDLCGAAKSRAKNVAGKNERPASVLAFHRVTESALSASADALAQRGKVAGKRLTAQPYRVGSAGAGDGLPLLSNLKLLKDALDSDGIKSGRLREIRGYWLSDQTGLVQGEWERWRKVTRKRDAPALAAFDAALITASGDGADVESWDGMFSGRLAENATPLFDAMEWRMFA